MQALVEVSEQKSGMMNTVFEGSRLAGVHSGSEGRGFLTGHGGQERGQRSRVPAVALREGMDGGLIMESESIGFADRGPEGGGRPLSTLG